MKNIIKALGAYAFMFTLAGAITGAGVYRTNQVEESQKAKGLERNLTEEERNFTTQNELPSNVILESIAKRIEKPRETSTLIYEQEYKEETSVETKKDVEVENPKKTNPNYDDLIEQIIKLESSGNPNEYNSRTKATGLMQVTPVVLKEFNGFHPGEKYSLKDMKNPKRNMEVGEWYLNRLAEHYFEEYGIPSTNKNLAGAYNAGPDRLRDSFRFGTPLPRETRNYMERIN
jgi:hypothetical protein